jgi:hypothetical protein
MYFRPVLSAPWSLHQPITHALFPASYPSSTPSFEDFVMRTEDPVWRCFGPPMKKAGDKTRVRLCKACEGEVRSLSCRARNHADHCHGLHTMGLWNSPGSPTQSSILQHTVVTPAACSDRLQILVGQFIYGNNLPFCLVENPLFRNLITTLRPGTKIPAVKAISGPLLEQVSQPFVTHIHTHH